MPSSKRCHVPAPMMIHMLPMVVARSVMSSERQPAKRSKRCLQKNSSHDIKDVPEHGDAVNLSTTSSGDFNFQSDEVNTEMSIAQMVDNENAKIEEQFEAAKSYTLSSFAQFLCVDVSRRTLEETMCVFFTTIKTLPHYAHVLKS